MRRGLRAPVRQCATASSSWFSKSRDADATPSTSSRSPGWVTLLRSSLSTSSAPSASPIDHCRLAIRAVPQRTSSSSFMVSGSNSAQRLLGFGGFALPQQGAGQQFAGVQAAAAADRRAGQPLAEGDVGQARSHRGRRSPAARRRVPGRCRGSTPPTGSARPGARRGWPRNARTSSPRSRRAAAIPRRRRITSPNSGWLNRTSTPWCSATTRISPRVSASSTASLPTKLVSVSRSSGSQKVSSRSSVQHIVGQLIDAAVEQRGQLGGDGGASAQLPHPAHLAQRSGFQRALDQVPHKQRVAAGGLPHQIGTEPLDAAAERLLDQRRRTRPW